MTLLWVYFFFVYLNKPLYKIVSQVMGDYLVLFLNKKNKKIENKLFFFVLTSFVNKMSYPSLNRIQPDSSNLADNTSSNYV